ncbi:hypothetical protein [Kitasatospora cheerisanensis]|uniref:hypothetical protein n=1 Tax=Kitasatospora cheerisanensis TaxID=81942 RepID=UPI0012ED3FBB|nr:hypothetical protein [Kitasatospora cheerisanensis]
MLEEIGPDELYADLIMTRSNDLRGFIIVEGRGDCAVLDRFIDHDHFATVPAHSKTTALGAVSRVHKNPTLTAIYAALDRDWVGTLEEGLDHPGVTYTDYYDLDACIFFAPFVYEDLAASFCTNLSFKHGTPGCGQQEIFKACVDLAFPVGMLRFISHRDGLGLGLRDFPLPAVINVTRGTVDLAKLIEIACKRAEKDPADFPGLQDLLEREISTASDREQYCSGHDLAKAFAAVAKKRWASNAAADMVERTARVALGREAFETTSVFRRTRHWRAESGATPWRSPN